MNIHMPSGAQHNKDHCSLCDITCALAGTADRNSNIPYITNTIGEVLTDEAFAAFTIKC